MVMVRLPLFEVICPKVEDVMLALGVPRFGWFRTLYISARNCSRMRSRMGCHRLMTVSKLKAPGLRRSGSVREPLPNEYGAGLAYALVSNHVDMLCCPLGRLPSFRRSA